MVLPPVVPQRRGLQGAVLVSRELALLELLPADEAQARTARRPRRHGAEDLGRAGLLRATWCLAMGTGPENGLQEMAQGVAKKRAQKESSWLPLTALLNRPRCCQASATPLLHIWPPPPAMRHATCTESMFKLGHVWATPGMDSDETGLGLPKGLTARRRTETRCARVVKSVIQAG